jgi:hypothetical protein
MSDCVNVVSIRTPAVIQAEIDALMAQTSTGVVEVRFADRTVKYDTMAARWAHLRYLRDELALLCGAVPKTWIGFHRITMRRV